MARRLARELTDQELARIFPGVEPGRVRALLADDDDSKSPARKDSGSAQAAAGNTGACSLYTDGASRGNPGLAGAGMVLLDADGREMAARSAFLGTCTNNVAEYKALLLGLELAREAGCSRLTVFLDSELVVRQLTGRYKVKNAALKPLYDQARQLLRSFAEVSINHVVRARNKRADALANQGIDNRQG